MKIGDLLKIAADRTIFGRPILFAMTPADAIALRDEARQYPLMRAEEMEDGRQILHSWRIFGVPVQEIGAKDGASFYVTAEHRLHTIEWST
jgi:hypothetical protein